VKDRAELVGIAFVKGVEIGLHHGFNTGTVGSHGDPSSQRHGHGRHFERRRMADNGEPCNRQLRQIIVLCPGLRE
jgi:hypothetical protein